MLALAAILALAGSLGAAEAPSEPPGYRLDDYRAPTPLTVAGRPAIDTAAARRLWEAHEATFIDVIAAGRPPDALPARALWAPLPHLAIPGGTRLPPSARGAPRPRLGACVA